MKNLAVMLALALGQAAACGGTQSAAVNVAAERRVPAKCTACHLAPKEHSLPAERWASYLKAHERRLRLTDQEKAFLYDFLIARP